MCFTGFLTAPFLRDSPPLVRLPIAAALILCRSLLLESAGTRTPLFVPEGAFESLVRQQMKLLRPHCLQAVQLVLAEMQRLLPACLPPPVLRYASLQARMRSCCQQALVRFAKKATEMVDNLIDIELAYLNTAHPDFVGGSTAMRYVAVQLHAAADEQQSREQLEQQPSQSVPMPAPPQPQPDSRPYSLASAMVPQTTAEAQPESSSDNFLNQFFGSTRVADERPLAPPPPPPPPPAHPPPPQPPLIPSAGGGANNLSREQLENGIIKSLLVSYYGIVRKKLIDSVPKAIMHFLVNAARANIQEELVMALYREEEFGNMLVEDDSAVQRRKACIALVDALVRAQGVLDELCTMPVEGEPITLR